MEVIINNCYGGFGLSDAAIERCCELGLSCTTFDQNCKPLDPQADFALLNLEMFSKKFRILNELKIRTNPVVISVVRELGDKAKNSLSDPKIIEIPFDSTEGWHIQDYDGLEKVVENHRSWS
jgi:hypothetical protein